MKNATEAAIIYGELKAFDAVSVAENLTGERANSNPDINNLTDMLVLAMSLTHVKAKTAALTMMGDSQFTNKLSDYQALITSIGFELALARPYLRDQSYKGEADFLSETQFIYAHRELGIILIFDTYSSGENPQVNGGYFYYCWKPNAFPVPYTLLSTGGYESETLEKWRGLCLEAQPDDLYWCGNHDCREAIRYNIQRLLDYGTFFPIWPKTHNNHLLNLLVNADYKDCAARAEAAGKRQPFYGTDELREQRYAMLPDWVKAITNHKFKG